MVPNYLGALGTWRHAYGENTRKTNIFAPSVRVRRILPHLPGDIDEIGVLPYKPRQLSAMVRLDRRRLIWAGTARFGRINGLLSIQQADLPGQRRTNP